MHTFGSDASPLHEVGVGEVYVFGVLQPGGREEDPDVRWVVRDPDGDAVVAHPAPTLLVGRVDDQLGGHVPSLFPALPTGTRPRANG
ncbi:hypothetical protein [Streptomyces sp. NPDC090445]|uniref:hypothetical protein n=1 Tax=Streptomyces sp. NPDC090445 TaxID=3365963 RepID=UPI0038106352